MNNLLQIPIIRLVIACLMLSSSALADEVRIELNRRAVVSSDDILLGDIARISASPAEQRTLERLDISGFPDGEETTNLGASLVKFRLRLEGWSSDDFRITGADSVEVRRQLPEPVSDTAIENAALAMMSDLLGVDADELRVGLSSPFMSHHPTAIQQDTDLRVEVLPPTKSRMGTVPLTIHLWRGKRLVASRPGRFEVLRRQRVTVARVSLQRDHVITGKDVQFENRFLANPVDQLDASQVVGQRVRSTVSVGNLVSLRDLQPKRAVRPEMVVKSRDKLRVIAVSGPLKVELRDAEALQNGAVGDTIRIRNLETRRVISGKITKPGEVTIRL